MWWFEPRRAWGRLARFVPLAATLGLAVGLGGCFQPLYGDRSVGGGPSLRGAMSAVDVKQIDASKGSDEARLAVELRNALLFDLTGGGPAAPVSAAPRCAPRVVPRVVIRR